VGGTAGISATSTWLIVFWAVLASFVLVVMLSTAVVRAMEPTAELLPRRLVMREDGLVVVPHDGEPRNEPWTWIVEAHERSSGIELSLARDRPVTLTIAECPDTPRIRRWLEAQGLLQPRSPG
jgi:hypothetical protein